jgi:hypothetical protein
MNYLTKCVISAIDATIYSNNSYDLGRIIGERIKLLESGNVEGADCKEFIRGVMESTDNHTYQETNNGVYIK